MTEKELTALSEQALIDAINELAHAAKERELSEDELERRRVLRAEYIRRFRASLTGTLDHTVIQRPDGSRQPLKRKKQ